MSDRMPTNYTSLADKSVFITGGATGIGEALVTAFVEQGAKVAFVDIAEEAGHALVEKLGKDAKHKPLFITCDITDIRALQDAVATAAKANGPITALLNNAANDTRHKWQDVTPEYWDERQAINIRPSFFAIQAVAPMMQKAGGGAIVNFGSVSWMMGQGGMPGYTTAKAATHGLTRGMARDLGKDGIRVNTLVPGWVMTQRQLDLWVDEAAEREIDERQCLKNKVMPSDIARMALFLTSDESRMVTAQNFIVDGGWV
ncbi:NAD(P)-dependent dehydrogenase, short-chain alcohol dehydrogenase family [Thalassospira xiamenensis M-5 = DSM 17429]|uniref:3-oxoacyl-ACP reductase n=1 Tax=Thalassospira xiamenensis M-5 = DSM 17429 TaxID=1123366 RepID=A0AB72UDQ9_9PROT|nr:SDR family oxidoreductase [Thalassospira xiamenensis]AJD52383.1 3-oxoacyl-ACP reductase [Thalassospira xiamenensis M-5 = DSM 17429]SIS85909.1 NAD(P)-dependent dehydrogenase, short-chain alcohol dehydrogenase family [Thalassospira xiamenensis M-5 = DSM 17429]